MHLLWHPLLMYLLSLWKWCLCVSVCVLTSIMYNDLQSVSMFISWSTWNQILRSPSHPVWSAMCFRCDVRLINLLKNWKLYQLCSKQRKSCVIALNVVICLRIFLYYSRGVYMARLYFVCSSRVNGCCLWWWWSLLPEVWRTSCLFVFGQHGVMDERRKRY